MVTYATIYNLYVAWADGDSYGHYEHLYSTGSEANAHRLIQKRLAEQFAVQIQPDVVGKDLSLETLDDVSIRVGKREDPEKEIGSYVIESVILTLPESSVSKCLCGHPHCEPEKPEPSP